MNTKGDRLPFTERAQRLLSEAGFVRKFDDLVSSELTFKQIEAIYGEETAINVGIARDPDAPEWTKEDWANARPVSEVAPHLVEAHQDRAKASR